MSCPLKYRFRTIDRLPEPPSAAAIRGTLVHAVLESLFDVPAEDRTAETARSLLPRLWDELRIRQPEVAELDEVRDPARWLASIDPYLRTYFTLEDPRRFTPASRELRLDVTLDTGVPTRGYVDRLDESPDGLLRIVDYKTGRAPQARFVESAMYQLKFYALMLYRLRGTVAARLRLVYLGSGEIVEYSPTEQNLLAFEQSVTELWRTITVAVDTGQFPARRSRLCQWCSFQRICPEFGGTPPPYPLLVNDSAAADGQSAR